METPGEPGEGAEGATPAHTPPYQTTPPPPTSSDLIGGAPGAKPGPGGSNCVDPEAVWDPRPPSIEVVIAEGGSSGSGGAIDDGGSGDGGDGLRTCSRPDPAGGPPTPSSPFSSQPHCLDSFKTSGRQQRVTLSFSSIAISVQRKRGERPLPVLRGVSGLARPKELVSGGEPMAMNSRRPRRDVLNTSGRFILYRGERPLPVLQSVSGLARPEGLVGGPGGYPGKL